MMKITKKNKIFNVILRIVLFITGALSFCAALLTSILFFDALTDLLETASGWIITISLSILTVILYILSFKLIYKELNYFIKE